MLGVVILCILFTIAVGAEAINVRKKNEKLERNLEEKELIIIHKNVDILRLQQELSRLRLGYSQRNTANQSEEIKAAIKYAMIKSHPDNGGSQNDFIKFRKLYQDVSK